MHYSNYHNALWDCFGFLIVQIGNMLPNQAMLPDWAIGPDCKTKEEIKRFDSKEFLTQTAQGKRH